jgi:hypothetical protein
VALQGYDNGITKARKTRKHERCEGGYPLGRQNARCGGMVRAHTKTRKHEGTSVAGPLRASVVLSGKLSLGRRQARALEEPDGTVGQCAGTASTQGRDIHFGAAIVQGRDDEIQAGAC